MKPGPPTAPAGRIQAAAVFAFVLVAQLALVAAAGTDVPFHDQWNIEGQWLYPRWRDGSLAPTDLLRAFNEHRILWTHLLNLGLFSLNGQWDPLVQMAVIAVLRAGCAAGLAWGVTQGVSRAWAWTASAVVAIAFLPHLAWHNALWGIESHALFALGFSLLTLRWLGAEPVTLRRTVAGVAAGVAGLFAMGPAALAPVPLLGLALLRATERRRLDRGLALQLAVAAGLLLLALALRVEVPEHADLKARGLGQALAAFVRVLAWPHGSPWAALAMNAPVLLVVAGRVLRRRPPAHGEDFVLLLAGWSTAIAAATAVARGGSAELAAGVPSRYVDFIVFLPLANLWCAFALVREAAPYFRAPARPLALAWSAFLLAGWIGLSAEVMRGLVLPRARDREAPVRLVRAYLATGDAAIFAGQPRLLVPYPDPRAMAAVVADPRLQGALPPSFQPERRQGPLSRAVRALFGHQ